MAADVGTTAAVMGLLPLKIDPKTGSRIPSISTGGAAINAQIKTVKATKNVGKARIPNQPI
jgi:hypothetical protein